jgi:transglutaminase-like putative cysteine protease
MALGVSLFSRTATTPKPARPSLTFFFFLVGAFLLTLVPHVMELPVWVTVSVVIALTIRSYMEVHRLPLPSTIFCSLVALCLLVGVMLQFHTMFGRDPGMAFTVGLLAIKFFELRGPRDIALIIFSGYFVVMSSLLFSQVIELFIYCLIMMWLLTALLRRLQIGDRPEDRLLPMLRWSGIIFLQALPLTIFLFFFFPRYQGKLQLSMGETALGFTDTVKPGDIASLSKNDTPAMYVKFLSDTIPLTGSMYWRGLVLWDYHNGAWTAGMMGDESIRESDQPTAERTSNLIEQEITIYPHFQKWLFALDYPVNGPAVDNAEPPIWSNIHRGDVLQVFGNKAKVDHKERYTVISSFTLNDQFLKREEEFAGLQLPGHGDKEDPHDQIDADIVKLADQLRRENPKDFDYRNAVLRYFRQQHFVYTASPGISAGNGKWLHEFLFTRKAGFCEHYAAAFAILMRQEKIPTRLVVGYQGATYNPYKNIYTVFQSNAHAWDEVWVDAKVQPEAGRRFGHWQRVDPTAYLPPGDGAQSPADNTGQQENSGDALSAQAAQRPSTFSETYFPPWMQHGFKEMQLRREALEADWDDLIFAYDPTAQNRLAQALGLGSNPSFQLGLICVVSTALCAAFFQRWMRRKPPLPPVENLYATFCQNMAQRGMPRAVWEGPLAYTGRVAEAFPEKEKEIRDVGSIVARSRYGSAPLAPTAPDELKSLLLLITASQAASSSREQT